MDNNNGFRSQTAKYLQNTMDKKLKNMVGVIRYWEKVKIAYIVIFALINLNLIHILLGNNQNINLPYQTREVVILTLILDIFIILSTIKTNSEIDRYQVNYKIFSEIINETDTDKVLDNWVENNYILKLKSIEDKYGVETKNTCLIDFVDKVKNISDNSNRHNTWEKVMKPNTLRTGIEVFWIIFKPVIILTAAFRLVILVM